MVEFNRGKIGDIRISREYLGAVMQALFVTVLWSSSWVIIKFGLNELPPLLFAGLRYLTGSILLLSIVLLSPSHRKELKNNPIKWWSLLILYGLIFITFTQGGQFLALSL
ncbi:MAG: EamA family transporter, partial [Candidatus Hodarchaeales archaeon]